MGPVILPPTFVSPTVEVAQQRNFSPRRQTLQSPLSKVAKRQALTIYFARGSTTLSRLAKRRLETLWPFAQYRITGFASSIGAPWKNVLISQKRAKTVAAYLGVAGVKVCKVKGAGALAILPYRKAQRVTIEANPC